MDFDKANRLVDAVVSEAVAGAVQGIAREAHAVACQNGFWGDKHPEEPARLHGEIDPETVAAYLCGIHSEVSEAYDALRTGQTAIEYEADGKPVGLPIELADAVMAALSLAEGLGVDIAAAIRIKLAFNRTRAHMHGGKLL